MTKRVLSIGEAAVLLGLSERTLYRAAKVGRLPGAFRVGGRWLIARERLERLMVEGEPEEQRAAS